MNRNNYHVTLPPERATKHFKDAKRCFEVMFTDVPLEHKIEMFRVMENAWPGVGWADNGAEFQKYYKSRGIFCG